MLDENPLQYIDAFEKAFQRANTLNNNFMTTIDTYSKNPQDFVDPFMSEEAVNECKGGLEEAKRQSEYLSNVLSLMKSLFVNAKLHLNCEQSLYPLWEEGVELAICTEAAISWVQIFTSCFFVSMSGILLYTLRFARLDIEIFQEDEDGSKKKKTEKP